jgi:hypothetical protein
MYKNKYLKYKNKYLDLKNNINNQYHIKGGAFINRSESTTSADGNSVRSFENFNRDCEVLSKLFQNIYIFRADMSMINKLISTNKIILLQPKNIQILTSIFFILEIKIINISDIELRQAIMNKYRSLFYSDDKYSIFGKSESELTPVEKEQYDNILDFEENEREKFKSILEKYGITSYDMFEAIIEEIDYKKLSIGSNDIIIDLNGRKLTIDPNDKKFFDINYYPKMMNSMNQTKINELYLNNMKVWYKSKFFLEEHYKIDIEKFYEEYNNFVLTNQSYIIYWDNIINILLFLCKIKTCRYYFSVSDSISFLQILEENKFNEFYEHKIENKYIIRKPDLEKTIVPDIKSKLKIKKSYLDSYYESTTNKKCKEGESCIYLFKLHKLFVNNQELIQLLFDSFSCNYNNILNLYALILNIFCKTFPDSQFMIWKRGLYDVTRTDEAYELSNIIGIKIDEYFNSINNDYRQKFNDAFKNTYLHFSFNLISEIKYGRFIPTNIISTLINPIIHLDSEYHNSILAKVTHDLIFHNLYKFKQNTQKQDTNNGIKLIVYLNKINPEYIILMHNIFHERQTGPFSFNALLEYLLKYNNPKFILCDPELYLSFITNLQQFFNTDVKYEEYQKKIQQILYEYKK